MSLRTTLAAALDVDDIPAGADAAAPDGSIPLRWTSGATVERWDWQTGEVYDLRFDPAGIDLAWMNSGGPLLEDHIATSRTVIGSVVPGSARLDGTEGTARVILSGAPSAADTVLKIRERSIRGVSMGVAILAERRVSARDRDDGETEKDLLIAERSEIMEISAVPIPADTRAAFLSDSPPPQWRPRSREEKTMHPTTPALEPKPAETVATTPPVDLDAALATQARESAETIALCAKHGCAELAADLIAKRAPRADVSAAILERLAAAQPKIQPATSRYGADGQGVLAMDLVEGMLLRGDPRTWAGKVSAQAERLSRLTLMDVAGIWHDHTSGRGGERLHGMELLQKSWRVSRPISDQLWRSGDPREVCLSTMTPTDLPGVVANVQNKSLQARFSAYPATWQRWVDMVPVSNLKPQAIVRYDGFGILPVHAAATPYQDMRTYDGKDTWTPQDRGAILRIDRHVMLNDDLGAVVRSAGIAGDAAANTRAYLVYSVLNNGGSVAMEDGFFFVDAARTNPITAAAQANYVASGAAPSVAEFDKIFALFGKMLTLDGVTPIMVNARFVIAPVALKTKIEQLLYPSAIALAAFTSGMTPSMGSLEPDFSPHLDAVSAKKWWIIAREGAPIQAGWLNPGGPEVIAETDFDSAAYKLRIVDIGGAAPVEYRYIVGNNGE